MERIRKMSACTDCGLPISEAAKRCFPCHCKWNVGENNPTFTGGLRKRLGLRTRIEVTCNTCKISYQKRKDTMAVWNGLCRCCTNKHNGAKMKGTWRVPRKSCVDCGKTSKWIKLGVRCKTCSLRYHAGENHYHWKGGVTPFNKVLRGRIEYKGWRTSVFERDNFTCQLCNANGCYVEADHIKPFAFFPELRYDIANGRTLCQPCHIKNGWRRTKANLLALTNQ